MKTRIAIFLAVELFCALLAWLAGWDFEFQRGKFFAANVGISFGCGVIAVLCWELGKS